MGVCVRVLFELVFVFGFLLFVLRVFVGVFVLVLVWVGV